MAKHTVLWASTARHDLESLVDYIAHENPEMASAVLARLERKAGTLAAMAYRGRVVPELRDIGVLHYRELVERPWRIVYRLDGKRALVIAVLDARRDLQAQLLERLIRS